MNSRAAPARSLHDDSSEHDELRVEAFDIGSSMKAKGLPSRLLHERSICPKNLQESSNSCGCGAMSLMQLSAKK
jgi:hypothetical protein